MEDVSMREDSPEIPFIPPVANRKRKAPHSCIFEGCGFIGESDADLEHHVEIHLESLSQPATADMSRIPSPKLCNAQSNGLAPQLPSTSQQNETVEAMDCSESQLRSSNGGEKKATPAPMKHDAVVAANAMNNFRCFMENCFFVAASNHGLQAHFEQDHSDGLQTLPPIEIPDPVPDLAISSTAKPTTNGAVAKKRPRPASVEPDENVDKNATKLHTFKSKNSDPNCEPNYQPNCEPNCQPNCEPNCQPNFEPNCESSSGCGISLVEKPRNTRYPGRDRQNRQTSAEREEKKKEEFTLEVEGILSGNEEDFPSDSEDSHADPLDNFTQLRALATAVEGRLGDEWEVSYEKDTQLKDGFVALYYARLQTLLTDKENGNEALRRVVALLNTMENSGVEYQRPDPHLLAKIRRGAANGKEQPELFLCNDVRFFGRDLGDSGWGCGYRNAQMLISSLLKWPCIRDRLVEELGSAEIPNIPKLQQLIERAWQRGFGRFAAVDLEGQVFHSSTWIGTDDIQALFSSMGIECYIDNFSSRNNDIMDQLVQFVHSYFKHFHTKHNPFVPPMFIQYSGHSRTVIGLDVTGWTKPSEKPTAKPSDKIGLLILDPSDTQLSIKPKGKAPTVSWYKKHIHCRLQSFKEETYQIMSFTGKLLSKDGFEKMKQPGTAHRSIACVGYC